MMKPCILLSALFVLVGGCAVLPPKLELPKSISSIEQLEPYLQRAVERQQPPGITLGVVGGDATMYVKSFGFADATLGRQATNDTVYQWWSLTKVFTAVAILQLEDKGVLDLDDSVSMHLPFFVARNRAGEIQVVTIRQLLSHSAGLGDIGMSILGWIHYEGDPALSQTELLEEKHAKYSVLEIQPGEEGRYSNFGYILLAGVIEAASGKSYESYVVENILRPLKMEHTDFIYTDSMTQFEATGSHPRDIVSYVVPIYIDTKRAVRESQNGVLWFNRVYSDQKGATGLIGSASDMLRFMRAMLRGGELDGIRILSQEDVARMQLPIVDVARSPAPDSKSLEFGLSWFVSRTDSGISLSHGGSGMAFVALLRLYPERDFGVLVAANSTYLGRSMGSEIIDLVASLQW